MADGWYDDPNLVAALPRRFRALAWYSRRVARPSGKVPGGSFLFRRLRKLGQLLRLGDTAAVHVGPFQVYVDLLDQRAFTVFAELGQPSEEFSLLPMLLPPGATFVDIGANHGSFSIRAAPIAGPSGRVIAVEPNERLSALLIRSLQGTGVPYEVHTVALGNAEGTATLHVPHDASGSGTLFASYGVGRRRYIRVPVLTADALLANVRPDRPCVVKLDVEGAEADVLAGAAGFLRRVRPIVLWELNPSSAAAAKGLDAVFLAFEAAGYSRFGELNEWPKTRQAAEICSHPQRNLLALPSQQ